VLVHVIPMLVVPMPVVDVVDVIAVLNGFVAVTFEVFSLVVGVDLLLGVPFPVVEMVSVAFMLPGGVAIAG